MGQPKEKKKINGLVGAKNRGLGGPTLDKRENEWISTGQKQGAGQANLRKRDKTNGLVGLKTEGRVGKPKEKREHE